MIKSKSSKRRNNQKKTTLKRTPFLRHPVRYYSEFRDFTLRRAHFIKSSYILCNTQTVQLLFVMFARKCKEANKFYKPHLHLTIYSKERWYRTIILLNKITDGNWREYIDFIFDRRRNSRKGKFYLPKIYCLLSKTNLENYFTYLASKEDEERIKTQNEEFIKKVENGITAQNRYVLELVSEARNITKKEALEVPGIDGFCKID